MIYGYVTGSGSLVTNGNSGNISFDSRYSQLSGIAADWNNTPSLMIDNSGVNVYGNYKGIYVYNNRSLNVYGDLKVFNQFLLNGGDTVSFNSHNLTIGYGQNGYTDMRMSGAYVYNIGDLNLDSGARTYSGLGSYFLPNEITSVANITNKGTLDLRGGRTNTFTVTGNVFNDVQGSIDISDKWTAIGGDLNNAGYFGQSSPARTLPFSVSGNLTTSNGFYTTNDAQDLNIGGDLTISGGVLQTQGTGKINVGGNFVNNSNYYGGRGLVFNGTGDQSLSSGNALGTNSLKVDKVSGKLTLNTTPVVYGDVTVNQGTLSIPSGYGFANSYPSNAFMVNSGAKVQLGGSYFPSSTYGTVTFNSGSTVEYNGAADQAITTTSPYSNLTLSGGSTKSFSTAPTINNGLILADGTTLQIGGSSTLPTAASYTLGSNSTVNYAGSNQTVANAPTYGNLTLSGSGTKSGSGALNVVGNWSNSVTFDPGSGTVNLTGGSQSLSGATTFNNLSKTAASAATLTFPAGVTQTILGKLTLKGADVSNRLALRSSSSPTQWQIDPQGTRDLAFLDVKDSKNMNAVVINAAGTGSIDSTNNTQWAITAPTISSVTLAADGTYTGGQPLTFTINWNSALPVTVSGTPQLALTIGANTRHADYQPLSSTPTTSVFTYTVADLDQAPTGISVTALSLNGGTIQSTLGADADLTLNNMGVTSGIKVRGTYTLTVSTAGSGTGTVSKSPNQTEIRGGTSVTLTANLNAGSSLASWNGDASGNSNPLTFSMDGDKTITAAIELTGNMYVDPSYTSSTPGWGVTRFATLQSAITYSSDDSGGNTTQINIAAGNYAESVNLNKAITLVPAAGVTITGTLTQSTGTISAPAGSLTVTGDYLLSGGTFNGNSSGTLILGGNLTRTGTGVFNSGGTVTFNGTSPAVISGVSQFTNLTLAGSSTVSSTTALNASGALAVNGGSFTPASGSTFHDVTLGSSGTLDLPTGGSLSITGDWVNNGIFNANGGTVTFNGSGDQSISGSHATTFSGLTLDNAGHTLSSTTAITATTTTLTAGTLDPATGSSLGVVSIATNGSLTLTSGKTISMDSLDNSGHFSPAGDVTISGGVTNTGTFNPGGGAVSITGGFSNSSSGVFDLSSGSVNVGSTFSNSGAVHLTGGNLRLAGDLNNNGSINTSGTSTVTFGGTGAQNIGGSNAVTFQNMVVNNSGTSPVTSTHAVSVNGDLTVTKGKFAPASGSDFNHISIASGAELDAPSGTMTISGNFANAGTFVPGSGTVIFDGSGPTSQIISGNTTTFNNLVINHPGGSVSGSSTPPPPTRTDAAHLSVANGTFNPADGSTFGSAEILAGGTMTVSGTETVKVTGDLTNAGILSPSGGTLDIGGKLINSGTFKPSAGLVTLAGDLTNNGTFAPTGGTFNFDGTTSVQTVGGSNPVTFASVVISNPNGVNGVPISGNDLTIPSGAIYTPPSGSQFHNVTIDAGGKLQMPSGGDISVSGNWTNNGAFDAAGNSTVTFDGTGNQAIGGTATPPTAFDKLIINNTGGIVSGNKAISASTLTVVKGIFDPAGGSTFGNVDIQSGGTLTQSTGIVHVTGNLSNEGTLSPSGGTLNVDGTLDNSGSFHPTGSSTTVNVGGTFSNHAGGIFDGTGGNLNLAGNLVNDGTFHPTGGTVTFDSLTQNQVISGAHAPVFNNLVIDNPGHTVTGNTALTAGLLTIANGTFHPANGSTFSDVLIQLGGILTLNDGETINVTHDLTNGGYLSPTGGLLNIGGNLDNLSTGHINPSGGTIDLSGDFTNGGAFNPSAGVLKLAGNLINNSPLFAPTGGTVDFDGIGPQTIDGSSSPVHFNNIQIDGIGPVTADIPVIVAGNTDVNQGVFVVPTGSELNNINVKPGAKLDTSGGAVTINAPVLANPIPDQTGQQDAAFNYTFAGNTFTVLKGSMTYTAKKADGSALPAWLIFNAGQRNFSGTPQVGDVGLLQIKLIATNGGGTGVDSFYITIQANSSQAPVLVNPIGDQNVKEGAAFNFVFPGDTFYNPDATALSYRADGLPLWLQFNGATRTFSGTPVSGAAGINGGMLNIILTAVNNTGGSAADPFTIQVFSSTADVPPSLRSRLQDQNGAAGTAFSYIVPAGFAVDASGSSSGLVYTAGLVGGGKLPTWLTFNHGTRTFSGLPASLDVGTLLVQVTVTDSNEQSVVDEFRINISSADRKATYLSLNSMGMTYVDGFGSVVFPPGEVVGGGHYYLMFKLDQTVPVLIPGYTDLLLGRQISLYDGSGNPVTSPQDHPIMVCFQLTDMLWSNYSSYTYQIVTTPNIDTPWSKLETKLFAESKRVCANVSHFSLFNLLAMPPASGGIETGFAPNKQTILPKQPASQAYQQMGNLWLDIPSLGLKENIVGVPMVDGKFDVSWLGNQIGWLDSTAYPGLAGNSVLTGHVYDANGLEGPFRWLTRLAYNDDVIVHIGDQRLVYKVRSVVEQADPDTLWKGIKHEQNPWMMLITCRGYDEKTNTYRWRTVIRAVLSSTTADQ